MIHNLIFIIFGLDIFILTVTLAGFIYTLWNIKRKKFNLIPRDYGLLVMYFTFLLFSLLSFVVEWTLYYHIHDIIKSDVFKWVLIKRLVHGVFTITAITWSSGYKFGGTQSSGI